MLRLIVSSLLLLLSRFPNSSNADHCFCPLREDVIMYREPSLSADKEGVIDDKQIIKGSYEGEWIRIEGENIMFALLEDFSICECPGDETGQELDCLDNSCSQRARRQLNQVAFWNSWSEWSCSTTCGKNGVYHRKRDCQMNGFVVVASRCPNNGTQFKMCENMPDCDIPEWTVWDEWSLWSVCSKTCETGIKVRMRNCTENCTELVQTQNTTCFEHGCNVQWTQWFAWNDCTKSCGVGLRPRYRGCTDGNDVFSSAECPFSLLSPSGFYQIGPCNKEPCAYSEWSEWTDCKLAASLTCGRGVYFRVQKCNFNTTCASANKYENKPCYKPCPGRWGEWEEWSTCDLTCGDGTQTRSRECNTTSSVDGYTDLNCTGDYFDSKPCRSANCPVDGQFSAWSNWTECSVSCNGGRQDRFRKCDNPPPDLGGQNCVGDTTEQRDCGVEVCPRDGGWRSWAEWSECSSTCDLGIRIRERKCNDPTPLGAGQNCSGPEREIGYCNLPQCDVDGGWSDWAPWSNCSCTNQTARRRQCNSPAPVGGGQFCIGEAVENTTCIHHGNNCPVNGQWAEWIPWGRCSKTCGPGKEQRFRTCTKPRPANGGDYCYGDESMTRDCEDQPCPVNGGWSDWSPWGFCSVTCGNGTYVRTRKCSNPAQAFGGDYCVGHEQDIEDCLTNRKCPIDGAWTDWSSWSDCSVTCGNGTIIRSRNCSNPAPQEGGKQCGGSETDTDICVLAKCPVDGDWSNWDTWSKCSTTCDGGTHSRQRTCTHPEPAYGGKNCSGSQLENEFCYLQSCKINGSWNSWEAWSPCTLTCGKGEKVRIRLCDNPPPSNGGSYCNGSYHEETSCDRPCPVNGGWSTWLPWKNCSVTCGNGTRSRTRICDNPLPQFGGKSCPGTNSDHGDCFPTECPVDGVWSDWSEWGSCSVTCANGTEYRTRNCTGQLYGGQDCPGNNNEPQPCIKGPCPIDGVWGVWGKWSMCSVTCGDGNSTRFRDCIAPQFGGKNCTGKDIELKDCFPVNCPVDGNWGDWYQWSHCTVTCETGTRSRARVCMNPPPQFGGAYCQGTGRENVTCDMGSCNPSPTTTDASPAPNTDLGDILTTVSTDAHTPNTGHTTHVHGSTPVSTSPAVTVPTTPTTTTQATTTASPVTVQNFKCHVCGTVSEQYCDAMFEENSCPYPYCVNEMRNDIFGVRYVKRRCGTERDCKIDWLSGTSDNDRCMNFDENQIYNVAMNCTYCCVNSLCNRPIRPDSADLYTTSP